MCRGHRLQLDRCSPAMCQVQARSQHAVQLDRTQVMPTEFVDYVLAKHVHAISSSVGGCRNVGCEHAHDHGPTEDCKKIQPLLFNVNKVHNLSWSCRFGAARRIHSASCCKPAGGFASCLESFCQSRQARRNVRLGLRGHCLHHSRL